MKKKNSITGYLFLLPSLSGVFAFVLLPFIDVIRRSFFSSITEEFKGFGNYADVIQNEAFRLAAKNTGRFLGICMPLLILLSLMIAVLMHGKFKSMNQMQFLKTAFLIPMAIPVASAALIWRIFFHNNGLINGLLAAVGFGTKSWMDSQAAFWSLVICYIWRNIGYDIILWMAGLSAIPSSHYEAAYVDGAGQIQSFFWITLPQLIPSFFTISVLSFLNSFKVFRESYLVAGDYPHGSMYLLQHLFNNWFRDFSMDKMAAGAVMTAIVIFILILFFERSERAE